MTFVGDVESCGGKRFAIVIHVGNEAGLLSQRPWYGIANGTLCDTHKIEDGEQSLGLEHSAHFAKQPEFVRDVHSCVNRVSAVKICRSERERKCAAVQEFHCMVEVDSARQTSGNEDKLFR